MAYEDLSLQCADCGCEFVFSAGEQEFYAEKGLSNAPKRCPQCRNGRKRSNGISPQRKLYDVICSNCGCEAKVPFAPSSDKPVYCKDCFQSSR